MTDRTYTTLEVEAALCLWEAALDLREKCKPLAMIWDGVGAFEMRHRVMALVTDAERIWVALGDAQDDIVFDWEFCPTFISDCVDWETGEVRDDATCLAIMRGAVTSSVKAL
jgi:hypothetical protein